MVYIGNSAKKTSGTFGIAENSIVILTVCFIVYALRLLPFNHETRIACRHLCTNNHTMVTSVLLEQNGPVHEVRPNKHNMQPVEAADPTTDDNAEV